MAAGLCGGSGNQWCEIPNLRYPGGSPVYSLEELLGMLGQDSPDDAESIKNRGTIAYKNGDVATARQLWDQAADAGNSDAMSNLGVLAQNDNNHTLAQEWFQKAADAGNAVAMYNLGNVAYGDRDLDEAKRWWERAADAGNTDAMKNLVALKQSTGSSEDAYSQLIKIRDETAQTLKELDDEVG